MSTAKGGFEGIVKQAQRMQQQIGRVQDQFAEREIEATAGGGAVTAVVNGKQQLVSITIQKDAVDPEDVEMLQELVLTAVNLAMQNASEMLQAEVNKITGGLNIPGLF